jgi:FkbM family methyltransferase
VAPDPDEHVFANGVRLDRRHLSTYQVARYRLANLHEPVEEEWLGRLLAAAGSAPRFADVGAGIGYYSILVKLLRPDACVFAFEPLPEHFERLHPGFVRNGIDATAVRCYELALCDSEGREPFHREDFGSRLLGIGEPASLWTDTTTLARVVATLSGPLDVVKVDVQGAELRVIAGAAATSEQIGAWLVGTHSDALHSACRAALVDRGYEIAWDDPHPPGQPDGLVVAVRSTGYAARLVSMPRETIRGSGVRERRTARPAARGDGRHRSRRPG